MIVWSSDFDNEECIPLWSLSTRYGGESIMPDLNWNYVERAQSYALLYYDTNNLFVHYFIPFIHPIINHLDHIPHINNKLIKYKNTYIVQGRNSFGEYGYVGPKRDQGNVILPLTLLNTNFFNPTKILKTMPITKFTHYYIFEIFALDTIIDEINLNKFCSKILNHIICTGILTGRFFQNII